MSSMQGKVWDGIYKDFAAVGADSTVFEGDVWLEKITERARAAQAVAAAQSSISPIASTTEYALPFVSALAKPQSGDVLRILDFGGGMATSYIPLRAMLPKTTKLDFTVVENGAVCSRGNDVFSAETEVTFRSDLPTPPDVCDIVHCGSSLHYVDDWRGILRHFVSLKPQYLLIADAPAADNQTFVTAQSFHGRRIPVRFWKVEDLTSAVEELGYELLLRARYRGYYLDPQEELPTENFDEVHRLTYMSQFVFRRAASDQQ